MGRGSKVNAPLTSSFVFNGITNFARVVTQDTGQEVAVHGNAQSPVGHKQKRSAGMKITFAFQSDMQMQGSPAGREAKPKCRNEDDLCHLSTYQPCVSHASGISCVSHMSIMLTA